ncbi:hypothetical protein D3C80_1488310 [compost metagenome]
MDEQDSDDETASDDQGGQSDNSVRIPNDVGNREHGNDPQPVPTALRDYAGDNNFRGFSIHDRVEASLALRQYTVPSMHFSEIFAIQIRPIGCDDIVVIVHDHCHERFLGKYVV